MKRIMNLVSGTPRFVMPGLVPGIQSFASADASARLDPGDKHRDDAGSARQ